MLFDLCIPYFIFSCLTFFILNLVSKSIDLVLSSSKWMLRLLSTNQLKMFSESSFSFFFNFINIFKLTNKACIISINKKITLDGLWHIINNIIIINISWPLPSVLVSFLRLTCSSISG